ncbi:MAG: phage holin family protein [Massilia sp.]|nr:phage holin family protein [Massilia sp.]
MGFLAAGGRIVTTIVAMAGTRLELAAVEFQEDARRLLGHLAWTLLAVFLAAGALLLAALFVIAIFWDSYRLQAVGGMAVLFGALAGIILMKVRASMNAQAPLLSATLAELRNDMDYLRHGMAQNAAHHVAQPAGGADE